MRVAVALLPLVLVSLAGCSDNGPAPEPTPTPAPAGPAGWSLVADGFDRPLLVTAHPADEAIFVVEQPGRVWRVMDGDRTPWIDVTDRVESGGNEQGLLGMAFIPGFEDHGSFLLSYTGAGGASVLSRFQAGGRAADAGTEEVLMTVAQPFANHNGGHIAYGPDGYLYWGLGDGGLAADPGGNGQSLVTLLGAMLRLDVGPTGAASIPASNPFTGLPGVRAEIWSWGLRNPWRFSFDAATGDLWIGDVGQNCWEEINFQPAASAGGENYGWARFEGDHLFVAPFSGDPFCSGAPGPVPSYTFPVAEYANPADGCSVTGGVVVRDPSLPAWNGTYLFGDFCSGVIWGMQGPDDEAGVAFETEWNISSFGQDAAGRVYLTDLGGSVLRLQPS